ncbi:hypothetical protein FGB62_22g360 [Gracilaria domingensis]|nr:hypothetical protein FGB62_22g360 [Gracilaria domingensis]
MAPTPSAKRRAALAASAANAELRALQMQLADLQSKRLHALRLYQSERTLHQTESARADGLATQLAELRQAREVAAAPLNKLRTEHFDANVRSVARQPNPSPMVSLTWHCLAMADVATTTPEMIAVLQPTGSRSAEGKLPAVHAPASAKAPHAEFIAAHKADGTSLTNVETVCSLARKLSAVSANAPSLSSDANAVIDQLQAKLNQSNSNCARLLATVQQQQETIQSLSRYSS